MGTAFPSTGYRIDGGAVYRPTDDITDGLPLRIISVVFLGKNGTFQVLVSM